jgi:hypothetical protein
VLFYTTCCTRPPEFLKSRVVHLSCNKFINPLLSPESCTIQGAGACSTAAFGHHVQQFFKSRPTTGGSRTDEVLYSQVSLGSRFSAIFPAFHTGTNSFIAMFVVNFSMVTYYQNLHLLFHFVLYWTKIHKMIRNTRIRPHNPPNSVNTADHRFIPGRRKTQACSYIVNFYLVSRCIRMKPMKTRRTSLKPEDCIMLICIEDTLYRITHISKKNILNHIELR